MWLIPDIQLVMERVGMVWKPIPKQSIWEVEEQIVQNIIWNTFFVSLPDVIGLCSPAPVLESRGCESEHLLGGTSKGHNV